MIFASTDGTRIAIGKNLSSTSSTTIVPAVAAGQKITLDSILVSCDGTGTAITVWWSDGTNNFNIINGTSVSANDVLQIRDLHIPLRQGYSLKCQAGTANHLSVTAVVIEGNSNRGANSQ